MNFRDALTEAGTYKFVIFDDKTQEPVDVAKTRKDAEDRLNVYKNSGVTGSYKITTYKKIADALTKMGDPDGKLKRINDIIKEKESY